LMTNRYATGQTMIVDGGGVLADWQRAQRKRRPLRPESRRRCHASSNDAGGSTAVRRRRFVAGPRRPRCFIARIRCEVALGCLSAGRVLFYSSYRSYNRQRFELAFGFRHSDVINGFGVYTDDVPLA
jgi:hypothetical protein